MGQRVVLGVLMMICAVVGTEVKAAPKVVTDIAPVQSLVAQVMSGVGTPEVLLPPGVSPHDFAMRPSQARNLSNANVVIWIGPALTPWLDKARGALAADTPSLTLMDLPGTAVLETRTLESFADNDDHAAHKDHQDEDGHEGDDHAKHDDHKDHSDHKGHDDHDDHGKGEDHGDSAAHKDHDDHEDQGGHHGHDHGAFDPHVWLDPVNAQAWLPAIAEVLAKADPENAATYLSNADQAVAVLKDLTEAVEKQMAPLKDQPFIVFHDATYAFERRYGLRAIGAVTLNDDAPPSPRTIQLVRDRIAQEKPACLFHEATRKPRVIRTVMEGLPIKAAPLDPLGQSYETGPKLYSALIQGLADSLTECLGHTH